MNVKLACGALVLVLLAACHGKDPQAEAQALAAQQAAQAVEEARRLDASTPGIAELQERVRVAARP